MSVKGTVKFYNSSKGYGFIAPEDGSKDIFVHATALEASGVSNLNEGDVISFEIEDDPRGRGKQATNIQVD
jgi:CspA family cold shock protein